MKYQYPTEATKEDFFRAFTTQGLLNELEIAQLRLHYQQPGHTTTPTLLGKLMGETSHQGVSIRNVYMAKKISGFLGIEPPMREDGSPRWWAYLVSAEKNGSYWQLELKNEVVLALKQMGWVQDKILPEDILRDEWEERVFKAHADLPEARRQRLEKASKKPSVIQVTRAEYRRNEDVVVEVLVRADGICEYCQCEAPFNRASDGTPYLEVHHILPLAEGGDDTVENAIALCPNCHRKKHYG